MLGDSAFVDLRRLADWFATSPHRVAFQIERVVRRLGVTAVPLLGRELRRPDARRREAARAAFIALASQPAARPRVIAELRTIAVGECGDESKVSAIGLLAELGEQAAAHFTDPSAIQRRSALALAAQLISDADVASAADLMIRQLATDDILQMLEVMAEAAPPSALRLANELAVRLDLPGETRERVIALIGADELAAHGSQRVDAVRRARAAQVATLIDTAGRIVVVASRKVIGERRWRRWAVLVGSSGRIDDCLHEDDAETDAASLIASLRRDGYRLTSDELEDARAAITAAARLTTTSGTAGGLSSAYYLGRDLLELGNGHVVDDEVPSASAVGRAVELIADGELAAALTLLTHCDPNDPDVAAALAACALADGQPRAAVTALERALVAEPDWPLHHWNLAAALYQLGDLPGCHRALGRFVATSIASTSARSAIAGDPDQPARMVRAERMMTELERAARLAGTPLVRRRRRTQSTSRRSRGRRGG